MNSPVFHACHIAIVIVIGARRLAQALIVASSPGHSRILSRSRGDLKIQEVPAWRRHEATSIDLHMLQCVLIPIFVDTILTDIYLPPSLKY